MAGIGDFPISKDSSTPIVIISNHTFTFAKFPFLTDEETIPSTFVSRIMFGPRLRKNKIVRSLSGNMWRGDIIIMCVSVDRRRVVNMRGHDAKLADFVLKKYV